MRYTTVPIADEVLVASYLLIDPKGNAPLAAAMLTPEDFGNTRCRLVFDAVTCLWRHHRESTPDEVYDVIIQVAAKRLGASRDEAKNRQLTTHSPQE